MHGPPDTPCRDSIGANLLRATPATGGFSLLELLLVLAIAAVIAGIAVPRYAGALARYQVDQAARRIESDLTMVADRARNVSASQTVTFSVAPGASYYEVNGMADPDRPSERYVVDLERAPYEVVLASADLGGDTSIVFNGHGVPDSGGAIVIRAGSSERTIVLDAPEQTVADEQ